MNHQENKSNEDVSILNRPRALLEAILSYTVVAFKRVLILFVWLQAII